MSLCAGQTHPSPAAAPPQVRWCPHWSGKTALVDLLMVCQPTPGELADMADGEVLNERFNPALHAPGEAGARGSQSICSLTRPQRRQSTRRTGSCNQTCRSNRSRPRTRRIRLVVDQWRGLQASATTGQEVGARPGGKQGVMVGRKRLGDDGITRPEGGNINMMHGDSRVMGGGVFGDKPVYQHPVCQLPLSQDPAKKPKKAADYLRRFANPAAVTC